MTDDEISEIILNELKLKSPQSLIADILSPRKIWDTTKAQKIKNIIAILVDKNLVNAPGKYFPATDAQLSITGYGLSILNQYGSYSSYLSFQTKSSNGFSHNIIGDNFQGNTIIIGNNNTLNQHINPLPDNFNYEKLSEQLGILKEILIKQATLPEHFQAIGEITGAEIASKEKDGNKVVKHLLTVGKWSLDFAKEIGVEVVAAVIESKLK